MASILMHQLFGADRLKFTFQCVRRIEVMHCELVRIS